MAPSGEKRHRHSGEIGGKVINYSFHNLINNQQPAALGRMFPASSLGETADPTKIFPDNEKQK